MEFTYGNRFINRKGLRYGSMVVLEHVGSLIKNKEALWKCKCDCGKIVFKSGGNLIRQKTCGDDCTIGVSTTKNITTNNAPDFVKDIYGVVYKLTNKIDGHIYIGQTVFSAEDRWKKHVDYANRGGEGYLQRAIRKYGPENFSVKTIDYAADKDHLDFLEQYHISTTNSLDPTIGYNQTWRPGRSEESRLKTSEKQLGELNHTYRKDLTPVDLKELYESGMSLSQIAKELGTTHHTIASRLRSLGVEITLQPNQKSLPDDEIIEEYKSGTNATELAKKYGVSRWVITNRLQKAGIELKPVAPNNGLKRTDVSTETLAAQFKAGVKIRHLALIYKMNDKTIRYRLKQAGIDPRKNANKSPDRGSTTTETLPQSSTVVSTIL